MNVSATMTEIAALSVEERLELMEAIWDSIALEPGQPPLTREQIAEVERRKAAYLAAPELAVPWEEVKERSLARARR